MTAVAFVFRRPSGRFFEVSPATSGDSSVGPASCVIGRGVDRLGLCKASFSSACDGAARRAYDYRNYEHAQRTPELPSHKGHKTRITSQSDPFPKRWMKPRSKLHHDPTFRSSFWKAEISGNRSPRDRDNAFWMMSANFLGRLARRRSIRMGDS